MGAAITSACTIAATVRGSSPAPVRATTTAAPDSASPPTASPAMAAAGGRAWRAVRPMRDDRSIGVHYGREVLRAGRYGCAPAASRDARPGASVKRPARPTSFGVAYSRGDPNRGFPIDAGVPSSASGRRALALGPLPRRRSAACGRLLRRGEAGPDAALHGLGVRDLAAGRARHRRAVPLGAPLVARDLLASCRQRRAAVRRHPLPLGSLLGQQAGTWPRSSWAPCSCGG